MSEIFSHNDQHVFEDPIEFDWVNGTDGKKKTNIHTKVPHHLKKGDLVKVDVRNGNSIESGIHTISRTGTTKGTSRNEIIVIDKEPKSHAFANGFIQKVIIEENDIIDLKDPIKTIKDSIDEPAVGNKSNLLKFGIITAIGIILLSK
jgi:hypothetical protein